MTKSTYVKTMAKRLDPEIDDPSVQVEETLQGTLATVEFDAIEPERRLSSTTTDRVRSSLTELREAMGCPALSLR